MPAGGPGERLTAALLVMAGGAFGALARHALGSWVTARVGRAWPWGTFAVNVLGCLVLGLVVGWLRGRGQGTEPWRPMLVIGFLGAFTTFSTFVYEGDALLRGTGTAWLRAAGYVLGSVAVGLLALRAGLALAAR